MFNNDNNNIVKQTQQLIVIHNTFNDKYITVHKQMLNGGINEKDILQKEFNIFKLN